MDYAAAISEIEARLKGAGKSVAEMLRRADVAPSQWQRWKGGNQTPHRTTWGRVVSAVDALTKAEEAA